jgi:hypothetical protein
LGKYEPLKSFLKSREQDIVEMTFLDIETVLGSKLPPSKTQRAFWSNNPNNNVMTREWLDAGFETGAVDLLREKLVFRRRSRQKNNVSLAKGFSESPQGKFEMDAAVKTATPKKNGKELLTALQANMAGLITLAPGFDPAVPMGEEWPEPYLGDGRDK